ncbi:hypothetical protein H4S01_005730, partial [Coemansia sp. RSA 2610]
MHPVAEEPATLGSAEPSIGEPAAPVSEEADVLAVDGIAAAVANETAGPVTGEPISQSAAEPTLQAVEEQAAEYPADQSDEHPPAREADGAAPVVAEEPAAVEELPTAVPAAEGSVDAIADEPIARSAEDCVATEVGVPNIVDPTEAEPAMPIAEETAALDSEDPVASVQEDSANIAIEEPLDRAVDESAAPAAEEPITEASNTPAAADLTCLPAETSEAAVAKDPMVEAATDPTVDAVEPVDADQLVKDTDAPVVAAVAAVEDVSKHGDAVEIASADTVEEVTEAKDAVEDTPTEKPSGSIDAVEAAELTTNVSELAEAEEYLDNADRAVPNDTAPNVDTIESTPVTEEATEAEVADEVERSDGQPETSEATFTADVIELPAPTEPAGEEAVDCVQDTSIKPAPAELSGSMAEMSAGLSLGLAATGASLAMLDGRNETTEADRAHAPADSAVSPQEDAHSAAGSEPEIVDLAESSGFESSSPYELVDRADRTAVGPDTMDEEAAPAPESGTPAAEQAEHSARPRAASLSPMESEHPTETGSPDSERIAPVVIGTVEAVDLAAAAAPAHEPAEAVEARAESMDVDDLESSKEIAELMESMTSPPNQQASVPAASEPETLPENSARAAFDESPQSQVSYNRPGSQASQSLDTPIADTASDRSLSKRDSAISMGKQHDEQEDEAPAVDDEPGT